MKNVETVRELCDRVWRLLDEIEKSFKDKEGNLSNTFIGIKCIWFDKNQVLQEAIFSTKDLMHI